MVPQMRGKDGSDRQSQSGSIARHNLSVQVIPLERSSVPKERGMGSPDASTSYQALVPYEL